MNEMLVHNWNTVVKDGDVVFHLGDFSMENCFATFAARLNGTIILIKGNHERGNHTILTDSTIYHHGKEWGHEHRPEDLVARNVLCGHVHEHWKHKIIDGCLYINVGVDVWDYSPVSMKMIMKYIEKMIKDKDDVTQWMKTK
jgi:calcineurin-like phosphoesterase family protein